MESDEKPPRRKKLLRRQPLTTTSGPVSGPAEPIGSAGPVAWEVREEFVLDREYSEGPIPSARELARYRDVDPSAPGIILKEFQSESEHRRGIEWAIVAGENGRADRGQYFALAVLLIGLLTGGFLVYSGHDVAGTVIAGADLVAGAALFIHKVHFSASESDEEK